MTDIWRVRHHTYRHLAETGAAPSLDESASALRLTAPEVAQARRRLEDLHAMALLSSAEIRMAHPFSARPTVYRVEGPETVWWANCAWDALAIPPMLGVDCVIESACADCGRDFDLQVLDGALSGDDGVVQFVVTPKKFWEDIEFT